MFLLVAAFAIALHGACAASGTHPGLVDDWLYCGLYLMAAASCLRRGYLGDARRAWTVAGLGVLVWGSAEIAFRIIEGNPHAWYPRASQALLFIGFLLAYLTLVLLARERVRRFDPVLALDGLLAGLAAASVAALVLFPALGSSPREPDAPPQVFLIGALVGLIFVLTVVGMTGWRPGTAWGADRHRDRRQRDRRRVARPHHRPGDIPPRLAGRHDVRGLGAAARARRLPPHQSRRRPPGSGAPAAGPAVQRLGGAGGADRRGSRAAPGDSPPGSRWRRWR